MRKNLVIALISAALLIGVAGAITYDASGFYPSRSHSGAIVGDLDCQWGGDTGNELRCLNLATNEKSVKTSFGTGGEYVSSFAHGGMMYFIEAYGRTIWRYNPSNNEIAQVGSTDASVLGMSCAESLEGGLCCGGYTGVDRTACYQFNTNSGSWSKVADLRDARRNFALVTCDNRVFYAVGGQNNGIQATAVTSIEKIDLADSSVSLMQSTYEMKDLSATCQNGLIALFGGIVPDTHSVSVDDIGIFNPEADSLTSAGEKLPVPLFFTGTECSFWENGGISVCLGGFSSQRGADQASVIKYSIPGTEQPPEPPAEQEERDVSKIVGDLNITGDLYVSGCIRYNCGSGCVTLGEC